jgi:nitrate reductase NapE
MSEQNIQPQGRTRKGEIWLFLFLSAVLIPVITFGLVASYGFSIWIYQIFTGPPTG